MFSFVKSVFFFAAAAAGASAVSQQRLRVGGVISDACAGIECGELKCPAGFHEEKPEGHCCGYCVNPNVKIEARVEGATGAFGGQQSSFCKDVWCFPTLCQKELTAATGTTAHCCPERGMWNAGMWDALITISFRWKGRKSSDGFGVATVGSTAGTRGTTISRLAWRRVAGAEPLFLPGERFYRESVLALSGYTD
eukprot:gene27-319_t